ncbi:MAG: hypothetical protein J7K12_00590 [Thermoplasmata archaeon]|nr:hypothetical protein [Thermoplasmata archaeon]
MLCASYINCYCLFYISSYWHEKNKNEKERKGLTALPRPLARLPTKAVRQA